MKTKIQQKQINKPQNKTKTQPTNQTTKLPQQITSTQTNHTSLSGSGLSRDKRGARGHGKGRNTADLEHNLLWQ